MINKSNDTTTTFVVLDKAAKMPGTCWGIYRRVAVLEVTQGAIPAMISRRARGVVRVVATWERCNVGKTDRCAFSKARAEARALAAQLNAGNGPEWAQG
jgi:hypothetical protein